MALQCNSIQYSAGVHCQPGRHEARHQAEAVQPVPGDDGQETAARRNGRGGRDQCSPFLFKLFKKWTDFLYKVQMFELINSMVFKFFWTFAQKISIKFNWWKEKSYEIQIFELKFSMNFKGVGTIFKGSKTRPLNLQC